MQDRGALPKEDGHLVREYKGTHEEHFLISWLREDLENMEERMKDMDKKAREEESRSGKKRGGSGARRRENGG